MTRNLPSMEFLTGNVQEWIHERNIDNPENIEHQMLKLVEEVGELSAAYNKQKDFEFKDSLGDIFVVLVGICMQYGTDIRAVVEIALSEISNRTGKMVNHVYIKFDDLHDENVCKAYKLLEKIEQEDKPLFDEILNKYNEFKA